MQRLLALVLAVATAPCFANQSTGSGGWHLYRGARALGPVTRKPWDPSPNARHQRMTELMGQNKLRYLMFMPASADAVHAEYGHRFPILTDEVAGPFVRAVVDLEVAIARHFEIAFAAVTAETDLLLSLATATDDTSARAIQSHLRATTHHSLGPWYDEVFLRALRRTKVRDPRDQGEALPALTARFLPNLATRLRTLAREGRRSLETAKPNEFDTRFNAWVQAPRPAKLTLIEIPLVESELVPKPVIKPRLSNERLAECLKAFL